MAARLGKVTKTLNELCKTSNLNKCTVLVRNSSMWTQDGIIKSPYKDIEIPNCTIPEYLWKNLHKWSDKTMAVCAYTGKSFTYEEGYKQSRNFAASLRKKFKIQDGDVVMIMLPNIPEYPLIVAGILDAGGVFSTINPIYTAHEIQRQMLMSEAKVIVTLPELTNIVREAANIAKLDIPIIVVRNNDEILPEGAAVFSELSENDIDKSCLKEVKRTVDDICFLPYSSGTTGLPKGVELTHKNIIGNSQQLNSPLVKSHNDTTATHQDTALAILPLYHIYGATMLNINKVSEGIKLVMLPKFKPDKFLQTLEEHRINILFVAPPIVILMGNHPGLKAEMLKHLDIVISGAAPLARSDGEKVMEKIKRKIRFGQGYGMTETGPVMTISDKTMELYDKVGHPLPNTELRIVDSSDMNKILGPNEAGEILVRGPQVMKGYKDNPKANSESLIGDGWFRTGDMGIVDNEGVLKITDRLKELIKVKGFQVPPAELEAVLREHPLVNDAAVIGVPHPEKGETPKAFVTLKPGQNEDIKNIVEFVSKRVAAYKRIDDIVVVNSIPKSAAGKILRLELKKKYC